MKISPIKHPEIFQGKKKKNHYFEGWYFKAVSLEDTCSLVFIPGISINKQDPHAFIQVFISDENSKETKLKTHYFRFDTDDFKDEVSPFSITIGKNTFSKSGIQVDLQEDDFRLVGEYSISQIEPIRTTRFSPNIMGPFAYVPGMECYHGVLSMNHRVNGRFAFNGQPIVFNHSKGYLEKDWGRSFPQKYIWIQSNHFDSDDTSFIFSYATIPFLGFAFKGLIANLLVDGKEYRFATYNNTKIIEKHVQPNEVHFTLKKGHTRLVIHAKSDRHIGLKSPKMGRMIDQIKEGLSGVCDLELFVKSQLVFREHGLHAGIEIMM